MLRPLGVFLWALCVPGLAKRQGIGEVQLASRHGDRRARLVDDIGDAQQDFLLDRLVLAPVRGAGIGVNENIQRVGAITMEVDQQQVVLVDRPVLLEIVAYS